MIKVTSSDKDSGGIWHPGELELQRRIGEIERMSVVGERDVRDYMPDQHREFFEQLSFILLGTVDETGMPWAGVKVGEAGFVTSPDPRRLRIANAGIAGDPVEAGLGDKASVGLLGIELHTRRRNRVNGVVSGLSDNLLQIAVEQSFGNCHQYIQLRQVVEKSGTPEPVTVEVLAELDDRARAQIGAADTFFVATYVDRPNGRQVDVSHRGGRTGFVAIEPDGALTIPDFAGNHFFATLGNILMNGLAGLAFIDFTDGTLLQMTGRAEILSVDSLSGNYQGAERFWRFSAERIVRRRNAFPMRFSFLGWSPNVISTGSWEEAQAQRRAQQLGDAWQRLRIQRVVDESATIRSLYLQVVDKPGLIRHQAGQHLPIRLTPGEGEAPLTRAYTISSAPSDVECYRISVKREGRVSKRLHAMKPGDELEVRPPAGCFISNALERRPAVLIAAGVGITPLLAMLRHTVFEGSRVGRIRQTWLFQAAHSMTERAFDAELAELTAAAGGAVRLIRVLSDPTGAVEGSDYDVAGRINIDILKRTLPFDDYDFYLCGPAAFMQSLYNNLRGLNIADGRIHAEAFGPARIVRRPDQALTSPLLLPQAEEAVEVTFSLSGRKIRWSPGSGTLLDLAEAEGLSPPYGCRGGSCGSCRASLRDGNITYPGLPEYEPGVGEVLLCRALPAMGTKRLVIDI